MQGHEKHLIYILIWINWNGLLELFTQATHDGFNSLRPGTHNCIDKLGSIVLLYIRIWIIVVVYITYLSKLHITQKRIARLILGKQKYYPSHGFFKELDMLSIYDINKCSLSMFCYKFNFGLLPGVFDNFFTKVSNVHRHHTKSQWNFHVRASRTIYVDNP